MKDQCFSISVQPLSIISFNNPHSPSTSLSLSLTRLYRARYFCNVYFCFYIIWIFVVILLLACACVCVCARAQKQRRILPIYRFILAVVYLHFQCVCVCVLQCACKIKCTTCDFLTSNRVVTYFMGRILQICIQHNNLITNLKKFKSYR